MKRTYAWLLCWLMLFLPFAASAKPTPPPVPPSQGASRPTAPRQTPPFQRLASPNTPAQKAYTQPGPAPQAVSQQNFVIVGFARIVQTLELIVFFSIFGFPLIVLVLVSGALYFTFQLRFINLFGFKHAIDIVRGKYDNPEDKGEISHFQALNAALSATVGLGNIAGVALAVGMGGPGAVFWMLFIAFFGMTAKFVECMMAQSYRHIDENGHVRGGPMYYLSEGLEKYGYSTLGKFLSVFFAICIIGGAFGGGNMFQSNQSYEIVADQIPFFQGKAWLFGLALAGLVALVVLGGIKRIGAAASAIVPFMVVLYIFTSLYIILAHADRIPSMIRLIVSSAFQGEAIFGGFLGAMVAGFRRAAFSNEAGIGSAAIAHSAAKTDQPAREGFVALLEPFIDTVVICMMTACVILITAPENVSLKKLRSSQHKVYNAKLRLESLKKQAATLAPTDKTAAAAFQQRERIALSALQNAEAEHKQHQKGTELTSRAFESVVPWFPYLLALAVFLFAYSTMISWSYYGEQGWEFLFGARSISIYRLLFLGAVVLGSVSRIGVVLDFSDMMILLCAFPNMIGLFLMRKEVKAKVDDYWKKYKNNEFKTFR